MKKIFLGISLVTAFAILVTLLPTRVTGQTIGVQLFRVFATRSNGLPIAIPTPYLSSTHISTVSSVQPKASVAVIGAVVIGVAGAAGSTVKLYNGACAAVSTANLMATVDGTVVGHEWLFGMIANDGNGFCVVTASGGAAPDFVVTWR